MKFRTDFVTNSSSSSFIIGKTEDASATVDSVFQLVRDIYKEYISKRDLLFEYIKENPSMNLEYDSTSEHALYRFKFIEGKAWDKKNEVINDQIEEHFGISTWDYFEYSYEWLSFDTYKEYEDYWLTKEKHAPFTIADFLNDKETYWLHEYYNGHFNHSKHTIDHTSDILCWYYDYIDEIFESTSCQDCSHKWCNGEHQKECDEIRDIIKNKSIPKERACFYLLGRICIYSECGYIPEYVVERLRDLSEYSCNHMG